MDAVIIEFPAATPVASPELLMVATPVVLDFQVAVELQSLLDPLEYAQVAVNCCVAPTAVETDVGETVMVSKELLPVPIVMLPVPVAEKASTPAESVVALAATPSPERV